MSRLTSEQTTTSISVEESSVLKLKRACLAGDEKTIENLIDEDPGLLTFSFPDYAGQTALHFAAAGDPKSLDTIVKLLKKQGNRSLEIALMSKDKDEKLPIDVALEKKQDVSQDSTLLKLLEVMGAKIVDATSATEKFPQKLYALVEAVAKKGHAWAQTVLGVFYLNAIGVARDPKESVSSFLKATEQDYAEAQLLMGMCYTHGAGVGRDDKQAAEWFLKAAKQRNADAQFNLGLCYDKGQGISQNKQEAVHWYREAATQGHASAQNNLAICYLSGEGVEKDEKTAIKFLLKAAGQGEPNAQYKLATCYAEGRGVRQDDQKAIEWFLQAAEEEHAIAQYNVGALILSGRIKSDKPEEEAVSWFQKAAEQGDDKAQIILGDRYNKGKGVAQDAKKSFEWYEKAAKQGNHGAQGALGYCYYVGRGVDQDKIEAMRWLHQSADEGNEAQAQFNLYVAYKECKDLKKAYAYCQKAAEQGHVKAQLPLADQDEKSGYLSGYLLEAKAYYEKAAASGDAEAKQHMTRLQAFVDSRFFKAIEEGKSEEVKVLIQRGTDVHKSIQGLQTALERAILMLDKACDLSKSQQENYLNIITQLVRQGAGLFLSDGGPLWIQANTFHRVQKRNPEILSALSESKIDNVSEMLSHFCQLGNLPFFLFLIDRKPNIHFIYDNMTTLFRIFVMLNKDVEKFDVSDFTNYFTIIYMLLERGAFLLSDEIPCKIEFMNFCEEIIKDVIVKYPENFSDIFKKLTQLLDESIGCFSANTINIIGQYCFFPMPIMKQVDSTKDISLVTERTKARADFESFYTLHFPT
jgi:TPR repeat protein